MLKKYFGYKGKEMECERKQKGYNNNGIERDKEEEILKRNKRTFFLLLSINVDGDEIRCWNWKCVEK